MYRILCMSGSKPPVVEKVRASLVNNNVLKVQWDKPKTKPKQGQWVSGNCTVRTRPIFLLLRNE